MSTICLYFALHSPIPLRKYSFFQIGKHQPYVDEEAWQKALSEYVDQHLEPLCETLGQLIAGSPERFKWSMVASGTLLEGLKTHHPSTLQTLQALSASGHIEWLLQPYYHSLSFLQDREEFQAQLELHHQQLSDLFGQAPQIWLNTALVYNNYLGYLAQRLQVKGIITEGIPQLIGDHSPHQVFHPPHSKKVGLYLRDYALSDMLGDRLRHAIDDSGMHEVASKVNQYKQHDKVITLGLDIRQIKGEVAARAFGSFVQLLLNQGHFQFQTPSEILLTHLPQKSIDIPHFISQAGSEKNLTAWMASPLQKEMMEKLEALRILFLKGNDSENLHLCRLLQDAESLYAVMNPVSHPKEGLAGYRNLLHIISDLTLKNSHEPIDR